MASKRDERLLGREFRKIQPKLRMFAKGSTRVNTARAEFAQALRVESKAAKKKAVQGDLTQGTRTEGHVAASQLKAPRLKSISDEIQANVFVTHFGPETGNGIRQLKANRRSTDGMLSTGTVALSDLAKIADESSVAFIELGETLKPPDAIVSNREVRRPRADVRNIPGRDSGGKGVLVGIIDVGGFDFSHEDFLSPDGSTRWSRIWDQGEGGSRPPPSFAGLGYGSEIKKEHMDEAIRASPEIGLPAWALEPQTQMSLSSHGTHVASIAAGNRGVCRQAYLAGVLISLPDEVARDRRLSFYDSTRVAHAVDYLLQVAEEIKEEDGLDELPVSINVSLGTNGGAHDASNAVSRWIDSALTVPGRCVCVAAGNSGQEAGETPEDIGFIMGRIHASGRIEARGLDKDLEWIVVGNGIADVSENELEIWYSGSDRFAVSVTPPGMPTIGPIHPQEYIQNQKLQDGSLISIYNELYHPANGENYISIYLSPFLRTNPVVGVRPGLWKVRLHGIEVRDGRFDGWIERDDPRRRGVVGEREAWNFPSFFSENSNEDHSSVSSLACGHRIVSVANLDAARERINISSSQGPTRDERFKPDAAAPGTDIVAANGFASPDDGEWIEMTGTSMASPYVAGVVGLMLAEQPKLTSAQVCGIVRRTSQPLPGRNFSWSDDSGYGVVAGELCVKEAKNLSNRRKLNP